MEAIYQYAWLIPVLPLFGAMVVGLGLISANQATNRLRQLNAVFIVSLMGTAMALSIALLWSQIQGHQPYTRTVEWAAAGNFHLSVGYVIDHLTALMLTIVTTVAILVMVYTDGYMSHDPGYVRLIPNPDCTAFLIASIELSSISILRRRVSMSHRVSTASITLRIVDWESSAINCSL